MQAPRPILFLCDVESFAFVEAGRGKKLRPHIVKRCFLREAGKDFHPLFLGDKVIFTFMDLMGCLLELKAAFA